MSESLFTAHDTADLINVLPVTFGFMPEESLCVISTTGPRHRFGFSARVDLPDGGSDVDQVAQMLLGHLLHHDADGAIVIAVGADPLRARAGSLAMLDAMEADGRIEPVVIAWADDATVWATHDPDGRPYRRSAHHAAVVQAVVEGRDIVPTRADLEHRIVPVGGVLRVWIEMSVSEVERRVEARIARCAGESAEPAARERVVSLLGRSLDLSDGDVVELCLWVSAIEVRDLCLDLIDKRNASEMLGLWQRACRLAPFGLEPAVLCLAAVAAHRIGDGAQMRIALEAATAADPYYPLAGLLTQILDAGIGPEEFERWTQRQAAMRPSA